MESKRRALQLHSLDDNLRKQIDDRTQVKQFSAGTGAPISAAGPEAALPIFLVAAVERIRRDKVRHQRSIRLQIPTPP